MNANREQKAVSIARRLDEREREMLRALFDYEVLLTYQIRVLFFSSARRAQDVTKKLSDLRLIEKDPPRQAVGIGKPQPMWAITEDGVRVLAVITAKPRSAIDWMPRYSYHDEKRRGLDHLLGVNRFFVSVVQASLLHQGHGLQKWVVTKHSGVASPGGLSVRRYAASSAKNARSTGTMRSRPPFPTTRTVRLPKSTSASPRVRVSAARSPPSTINNTMARSR